MHDFWVYVEKVNTEGYVLRNKIVRRIGALLNIEFIHPKHK